MDGAKIYSAYAADTALQKDSSSGGVFCLLAKQILKCGGVVFGAAFDEHCNVRHISVEEENQLFRLRGSKYIQSNMGNVFRQVRVLLQENRQVLFCGTPCQVKGLLSYVGEKLRRNLFAVDFACHGVPSEKVWHKYNGYHSLKSVAFRNKKYGWKTYSILRVFHDGKRKSSVFTHDKYMQSFIRNYTLRPSCYRCTAKGIERDADITLADYWGAGIYSPNMNHLQGVSLIIVHTVRGQQMLDSINSSNIIKKEEDINLAIKMNDSLLHSSPSPVRRQAFFEHLDSDMSFDELYKRYVSEGLVDDLKLLIKGYVKIAIYLLNRCGIRTQK